jgi:hypothetical protein
MLRNRFLLAALLSVLLAAFAQDADAQVKPVKPVKHVKQDRQAGQAKRVLGFLAGGFAGLVAHEGGHVLTGAVQGADPGFKRLDYGVIPFFAVTHDPVSRRGEYVIASSGFHAQHLANEWLLRSPDTTFEKGWLTFNLATSAVYTVAALGEFGPAERDTLGMAVHAGETGVPERVIGVLILAPAALDGVRYAYGDPAWARWASRAFKAGLLLLALR